MKILEMTLPPKKPMQKITTPREQPVAIAVRKPFHARSFFPAPVFCATNADTDCITEDGISMMNEVSFCATPYPADGIRPMPLMIELIIRKEICTVVSCSAIGTPTFRTFFSSSWSMRQSSFLNSIGRLPFFQHTHGGDDRNQLRQNRCKRCSRNVQFQHTDEEQISGNIGCAGDADE